MGESCNVFIVIVVYSCNFCQRRFALLFFNPRCWFMFNQSFIPPLWRSLLFVSLHIYRTEVGSGDRQVPIDVWNHFNCYYRLWIMIIVLSNLFLPCSCRYVGDEVRDKIGTRRNRISSIVRNGVSNCLMINDWSQFYFKSYPRFMEISSQTKLVYVICDIYI